MWVFCVFCVCVLWVVGGEVEKNLGRVLAIFCFFPGDFLKPLAKRSTF